MNCRRVPRHNRVVRSPGVDRSGYLYVGVMLVATLAGLVGLTAIRVGRLHLRSAIDASSAGHAARLSSSAIEHALATLQNDNDWRNTYDHDVEYPSTPVSIGTGTWTWKLVDDDGVLDDDDSDFVRIVGIGRDGDATIAQSITVYPSGSPVASLDNGLHASGNVTLSAGVTMTTNHTVSSNATVSGPGSSQVSGNAEATTSVTAPVSGTTTTGTAARRMPGSSVFDYYRMRGADIDVLSLPQSGTFRVLENTLLSPASNAFGTAHPAGLYVIDCQNQKIRIRDCRIVGTLLLLNPGSGSEATGALLWEQAVSGFPALLVDGPFQLNLTSASLSEATTGANFNPASTPYQDESDSDTTDVYTTRIAGGVYVAGDLTISSSVAATVAGTVIVSGTAAAQANATFNFDLAAYATPPPGFATGNPMLVVPGSLKRETLP